MKAKRLSLVLLFMFVLSILMLTLSACGDDENASGDGGSQGGAVDAVIAITSQKDGDKDVSQTPTIKWTATGVTGDFKVIISTKRSLSDPIVDSEVSGNEYTVTKTLTKSTFYYMVVTSKDGAVSSSQITFTTVLADTAVLITSPVEADENISINPTITWTVGDDAGNDFIVLISMNKDLSKPIIEEEVSGTEYTVVDELAKGVKHYVIVSTKDGKNKSTQVLFTTRPADDHISITSPSHHSTEVSITPTFTWEAGADAGSDFTVVLSANEDLSNPILEAEVSELTYTVTEALTKDTEYYLGILTSEENVKSDTISFTTVTIKDVVLDDFIYAVEADITAKWAFTGAVGSIIPDGGLKVTNTEDTSSTQYVYNASITDCKTLELEFMTSRSGQEIVIVLSIGEVNGTDTYLSYNFYGDGTKQLLQLPLSVINPSNLNSGYVYSISIAMNTGKDEFVNLYSFGLREDEIESIPAIPPMITESLGNFVDGLDDWAGVDTSTTWNEEDDSIVASPTAGGVGAIRIGKNYGNVISNTNISMSLDVIVSTPDTIVQVLFEAWNDGRYPSISLNVANANELVTLEFDLNTVNNFEYGWYDKINILATDTQIEVADVYFSTYTMGNKKEVYVSDFRGGVDSWYAGETPTATIEHDATERAVKITSLGTDTAVVTKNYPQVSTGSLSITIRGVADLELTIMFQDWSGANKNFSKVVTLDSDEWVTIVIDLDEFEGYENVGSFTNYAVTNLLFTQENTSIYVREIKFIND